MNSRKEIYRKFLKAKGRYTFWYAMNLTTDEQKMLDEPHAFKEMISWIISGDEVIFRCGFGWNVKRGEDMEEWVRERMFAWDGKLKDFVLKEELTYRGE